ncbi:MAG: SRPBCC family protein [Candidatus Woesebacteria bacterium]
MNNPMTLHHYEESRVVNASPDEVFSYIDDHSKFSSHMNQSSWMLGGGKMATTVDQEKGQVVGSHIKMDGIVFGFHVFLDEMVTYRQPPRIKVWETVGIPRLLIIGHYQMKVEIQSVEAGSKISVSIEYQLPDTHQWLGKLFSAWYAKWCVRQMLDGTSAHFMHTTALKAR